MSRVVFVGMILLGAVVLGCGAPAPEHHLLFGGDTGFGESYRSSREMLEEKGYDHSFKAMRPLLNSAEVVVANLETPITDVEESPHEGKITWLHKADVEEGPRVLKKYNLQVLALGNNHLMDYGPEGLDQTLEISEANGFEVFGAGQDLEQARKPFEREIELGETTVRVAIFSCFEYVANWDVHFAFYARPSRPGVNRLSPETMRDIRRYREQYPEALIVAYPHWGTNYEWKTPLQTQWGYRLIDAGADIVIGHGSHMLQEIERYSGRWILYGLGNFIFNSPGRYAKLDAPPYSLAAGLTLQPAEGRVDGTIRLYPIFSDNKASGFRPRPVTAKELDEVAALLKERSAGTWRLDKDLRRGRNGIGPYFELDLR